MLTPLLIKLSVISCNFSEFLEECVSDLRLCINLEYLVCVHLLMHFYTSSFPSIFGYAALSSATLVCEVQEHLLDVSATYTKNTMVNGIITFSVLFEFIPGKVGCL